MSVQSLIQQAGLKVPIAALFFANEHEGNIINVNFIHYVRRFRSWERRNLREQCKCGQDGDCLCYLFQIRHMMIEEFWCEETDFMELGDWLSLNNQHRRQ